MRFQFPKSVLRIAMTAMTLAVSSAYAAPVGPAGSDFYAYPAAISGSHGDLIQYRPATVNLGDKAPAFAAWNVLYQSTDSQGAPNAVSGTVIVPTAAWAKGPRPVILYAPGDHGLGIDCAASRQFEKGTDYESANILAALKAGYAVLVTDYAGYLTGAQPTYLAGRSQANAAMDIFTAALAIPNVGISGASPVGIWGFSQGGQTAAWAAETASAYAPGLKLVGVAAGTVPADFFPTAKMLDGNLGGEFIASSVIGLGAEYPDQLGLAFNLVVSDDGVADMAKLGSECVFKALPEYRNRTLASFTKTPTVSIDKLLSISWVHDTLDAQTLGRQKVSVPVYQYHGRAEEFIPLTQALDLKKAYCAAGATVWFDLFPGEHISTQSQAAPYVLSWMADRFAGKTAPSTCSNTAAYPTPTNTNPTGGGDFLMQMDKWPLTASVTLKGLNQTVDLPKESTFSAMTDLTTQQLTGSMAVPDFKATIKIIGLPISIGMKVTPVGDTKATGSLDDGGKLHVHGTAFADLTLTSLVGLSIGECKTATPVAFPLDYDGPVSVLGTGLTFAGTTSFPQLKGCLLASILSALMSGAGQTYSFTVNPPAPVKF